jgi:hypothetical protein
MGKFLKQSPGLKNWANQFKLKATSNLQRFGLYNTGALARSIRTTLRDGENSITVDIFYLFYGQIQENNYPAGHKWGRGKLKQAKKGRPWFSDTYRELEDELTEVIANDIATGFYNSIEP